MKNYQISKKHQKFKNLNKETETQETVFETHPNGFDWYKSLTINQRFGLREASIILCGLKWEDFIVLFTPRQRIEILYNKLKLEGIIV